MVYSCLCVTTAEMSSCKRHCIALKAKNICSSVLYRKGLLILDPSRVSRPMRPLNQWPRWRGQTGSGRRMVCIVRGRRNVPNFYWIPNVYHPSTHIVVITSHKHSAKKLPLFFFQRWGKWGPERLSDLPTVSSVLGRPEISFRAGQTPKPMFFLPYLTVFQGTVYSRY